MARIASLSADRTPTRRAAAAASFSRPPSSHGRRPAPPPPPSPSRVPAGAGRAALPSCSRQQRSASASASTPIARPGPAMGRAVPRWAAGPGPCRVPGHRPSPGRHVTAGWGLGGTPPPRGACGPGCFPGGEGAEASLSSLCPQAALRFPPQQRAWGQAGAGGRHPAGLRRRARRGGA